MTLPNAIKQCINIGIGSKIEPYDPKKYKAKVIDRKWRNLVGEIKLDLPEFLHEYINFPSKQSWEALEIIDINKIKKLGFEIIIPELPKIIANYKECHNGDWSFDFFEITYNEINYTFKKNESIHHVLFFSYSLVKCIKTFVKFKSVKKDLDYGVIKNYSYNHHIYTGMD